MKPRNRGIALSLSQGGEGEKGAGVLKDLPVCSGDEQRGLVGSGSGPAPCTDGLSPVVSTRPYGLPSAVHITPWPTVLSILGRRVVVGHSHFQDHDDVGLLFEGVHTLDQLGVMEAVHDADLLPDVLLLFC